MAWMPSWRIARDADDRLVDFLKFLAAPFDDGASAIYHSWNLNEITRDAMCGLTTARTITM